MMFIKLHFPILYMGQVPNGSVREYLIIAKYLEMPWKS